MAASFFSDMKSLVLLFQQGQFASPKRPEQSFSIETFREECRRQEIAGSQEVYLQVVYHVPHFIVLPKDIDACAVYQHHFPEIKNEDIACAQLSDKLQKIAYPKESALEEVAEEMLPHHQLLADAYLLLNYAIKKSRKQKLLLLHRVADDLQVILAQNGQLLFANSFKAANNIEAQYFIAAVAQEYGPVENVLLGGDPALEDVIKEHFKHISRFSIPEEIQEFLHCQSQLL